MFCTTLRKQPEWAPTISSLLTSTSPKFQERTLSTHDIAYPLLPSNSTSTTTPSSSHKNKTNSPHPNYIHFLLLSPTSLHEINRPTTLARIDRLSSLTGSTKDVGIIFLLSDHASQKSPTSASTSSVQGTHAFMELQLLLHSAPTTPPPSLPLIPLPTSTHLLQTLNHYATTLSHSLSLPHSHPQTPHQFPTFSSSSSSSSNPTSHPLHPAPLPPKPYTLTHLLPTTTTTYPPHALPQHATNVLSDLVPSLGALVEVVGSERGKRWLEGFLGREVVVDVVEFWEGEWVVE